MGASVFQGAVMRSPFPAWQWQSIIMGSSPSLPDAILRAEYGAFCPFRSETRSKWLFRCESSADGIFRWGHASGRPAGQSPSALWGFPATRETFPRRELFLRISRRRGRVQSLCDTRTTPRASQDDFFRLPPALRGTEV